MVMRNYSKKFLDALEIKKIETAIAEVESRTQAEIVPVIARQSGNYGFANSVFAFTFALLVLTLVWLVFQAVIPGHNWGSYPVPKIGIWVILCILILAYFAGLLLTRFFPALGLLFTTKGQRKAIVEIRAREQFQRLRVRRTKESVGVLIYISLLERMVHVVGDDKVNKAVEPSAWQTISDTLTSGLKAGDVTKALEDTVSMTGDILAPHLPLKPSDEDELVNKVYFV